MPRTVQVTLDEYAESIGFATYAFLTNKIIKRDLLKGAKRALGEYLESFLRGKLAEIGFKKFLLGLETETLLDIDLPIWIDGKYLPDILATRIDCNWVKARFWTEVKAVTPSQQWMLVTTTSVQGSTRVQPRPFCVYVNCRVDLPENHVARLIKHWPRVSGRLSQEWISALPDLVDVPVEIVGFALFSDIQAILSNDSQDATTLNATFGNDNWKLLPKRKSFKDNLSGKRVGNFYRDNCIIRHSNLRSNWDSFVALLRRNSPLAPVDKRDFTAFDTQMNNALTSLGSASSTSWFTRTLT